MTRWFFDSLIFAYANISKILKGLYIGFHSASLLASASVTAAQLAAAIFSKVG